MLVVKSSRILFIDKTAKPMLGSGLGARALEELHDSFKERS